VPPPGSVPIGFRIGKTAAQVAPFEGRLNPLAARAGWPQSRRRRRVLDPEQVDRFLVPRAHRRPGRQLGLRSSHPPFLPRRFPSANLRLRTWRQPYFLKPRRTWLLFPADEFSNGRLEGQQPGRTGAHVSCVRPAAHRSRGRPRRPNSPGLRRQDMVRRAPRMQPQWSLHGRCANSPRTACRRGCWGRSSRQTERGMSRTTAWKKPLTVSQALRGASDTTPAAAPTRARALPTSRSGLCPGHNEFEI
jgi:hypothetical protein